MFSLVFVGLTLVMTALGLWWSQRGEESKVSGAGNNFEAYYGKDASRGNPKLTPPCDGCISLGCIGAGECRCACHREKAA